MNIITHSVVPERVMAYLDGELSGAEALAVAAHLDQCAECADLAGQFRSTSRSISGWKVPEAPSSLDEPVSTFAAKAAFASGPARPGASIRVSLWNRRLWVIGGAVTATLLLAAALGSVLYRPRRMTAFPNPSAEPAPSMQAGDLVGAGALGRPMTGLKSEGAGMRSQPVAGRAFSSLAQLAPAAPGIAADSNGLLHGLGDHTEAALTVDGQNQSAPAPMIARTVSLTILVKDFSASRLTLDTILARHRGYSAQLSISTPENAPRGFQASLRIPAPELAAAVGDLRTLGRVENESQSGEEVTQRHTDLVARLKTARDTEARFETILQQRTGNVAEVLQVEEGIARVRGEIESMETEQKALEHRVDFASVDLQLTEEYKAQLDSSADSASTRVHNAFVEGIRNASGTLLGIVLFFEEYGPALLIWLSILGLPVFLAVWQYRRIRGRI
jgi:anti-sigma factor RsiW